MNKILFLIFLVSFSSYAQSTEIDTILPETKPLLIEVSNDTITDGIGQISSTNIDESTPYTDIDLQQIDSLLVDAKYNSPLFDSIPYVINETELSTNNIEYIVTTDVLKKRLAEINTTTPFHLEYNPALERVINNYVKYRKKYYPALMARAKYYFPLFEQYLDQFDIPLEMKYLSIVESALDPRARSRVGATGLWQFMYGTGKQFKLDINSYIDERQDPVKATISACKYLKQLFDTFGDWDLALAAYNSGPGNVLKAIKRSGGHRNYWNIRQYLPYETAGYVPAFYATMYIFKYANELNIYSDNPNLYYFETDTLLVKKTVSFDHISKKIGVKKEVLQLLNPKYKIDIIPSIKDKFYSVRLPRKKALSFIEKEQEIYELAAQDDAKREKPIAKNFVLDSNRIRYRVRGGDYLGKIARRFGVKVSQIKRWNNMRSTRINVGQKLYIYPRRM